jgi:hypothetical protein
LWLYDEGFTKSRSRYSISPEKFLSGLDRALEDIDEMVFLGFFYSLVIGPWGALITQRTLKSWPKTLLFCKKLIKMGNKLIVRTVQAVSR